MVSKNSIVEHTGLQHGLYCVTICTVFAIVVAATALMGDEPEVETATPTWVSYDWMPQAEDCSFYVAGPETGSECGQPRETQVIFFRVPLSFEGEITFRLEGTHLPFETVSGARARLYGGPGAYTDTDGHQIYPESDYQGTLLASKPLVTDHRPQRLHFGPFASSQGESVDGWGYFKLVFTVAKGRGLQPFRVAVAPADKVEGFCFNASLYMDGAKFGRALLYLDSVDKKTPITGITSGFAKGLSLREGDTSLALKAPNSENWIRYGINNFAAGDGRSALEWMNGTLGEGNNFGKRLIVAFTDSKGQPLRLFGNSRIVEQSPRMTAKRPKSSDQRPQTADRRPKKAAIPDPVSSIENPSPQHSNLPVSGIDTPTLQRFGTPTLQHSNTPTLQHSNTPTLQHSNAPTLPTPSPPHLSPLTPISHSDSTRPVSSQTQRISVSHGISGTVRSTRASR
ncbi:MAG: hypothetical protein O3B01_01805 [Planctomycetota bacterium]|nr:hypothetical protein [Planctomycetota bacterium]